MAGQSKRKLFIVGGKSRNVPRWLSNAFDYEQLEQDHPKTRTLEPSKTPDAVIVLSSWVGHEHFYGARDLAERLGIPLILSPGGWTSSLKGAADLGVEWFIQDIERARSTGNLTEAQVEEVAEFIDNAWREAYNREWAARNALERRCSRLRKELEGSQTALTELKERGEAARRVVAEVRAAAAKQREALEKARTASERRAEKIQARSERVSEAISHHMISLLRLFEVAEVSSDALHAASVSLGEARGLAKEKLATLKASLSIAEEGLPTDVIRDTENPVTDTISTFNAATES